MREQQRDFQHFYEQNESAYYNVALRWVRTEAVAMDYVHDTMLELWKHREKIPHDKWKTYGYSILLNKLRNSWKRKKIWKRVQNIFSASEKTEDYLKDNLLNEEILAALHALSDEHREILVLTELSDLSHKEIAELQGIPQGTVGSRRHTALEQLRERMKV